MPDKPHTISDMRRFRSVLGEYLQAAIELELDRSEPLDGGRKRAPYHTLEALIFDLEADVRAIRERMPRLKDVEG